MRYDRDGDQHYDVISAFIKSIRGSDADAALHYLARMLEAGEDARFIARRLVVHASEDVGLADPTALLAATAAAQAVQLVGLPEARINLAQATLHLALAPKSNAVVKAIGRVQAPHVNDALQRLVRRQRLGQQPFESAGIVRWDAVGIVRNSNIRFSRLDPLLTQTHPACAQDYCGGASGVT